MDWRKFAWPRMLPFSTLAALHGLRISDGAWQAAASNVHLYNQDPPLEDGKELQDELGLGWHDYGARMMNPRIGRWNGVDALGGKYPFSTPYSYTLNTPINAVDPDGRLVIFINGNEYGSGASGYLPWWYRYPNHSTTRSMFPNRRGTDSYWGSFDDAVMRQLRDENATYRDGSFGGAPFTRSLTQTLGHPPHAHESPWIVLSNDWGVPQCVAKECRRVCTVE